MSPTDSDIESLIIRRPAESKSVLVRGGLVTSLALMITGASALWMVGENQAEEPALLSDALATSVPREAERDAATRSQAVDTNAVATILDASGHVVARRIATVSSRVTGKLEALHIEEGKRVAKYDVLAELEDRQARISHQLARAEVDARAADLQQITITHDYQQQLLKRHERLAQENLMSEQTLADTRRLANQAAAQLRHRQAKVAMSLSQVELAQYQLDQHRIRAPFDGVVISKNAQVGELISAGNSGGGSIRTSVGTIVDMDSLEIEVEVSESYINRVYPGQRVESRLDAYPDWPIGSEVIAIIPTADRQTASITVRIRILMRDPRILPDMGVRVSFLG